jgi:hypothetical protein
MCRRPACAAWGRLEKFGLFGLCCLSCIADSSARGARVRAAGASAGAGAAGLPGSAGARGESEGAAQAGGAGSKARWQGDTGRTDHVGAGRNGKRLAAAGGASSLATPAAVASICALNPSENVGNVAARARLFKDAMRMAKLACGKEIQKFTHNKDCRNGKRRANVRGRRPG